MSRKVFISSDISIDENLDDVASEDALAALLWPWFLTCFDDWGRSEASPKRLKNKVFPGNDLVTVDVITNALQLYHRHGLIKLYDADGKLYMAIDQEKWFKYQTHIRREKREKDGSKYPAPEDCAQMRADARDNAQQRAVADDCAPSPSPSLSPSPSNTAAAAAHAREQEQPEQESFPAAYRRVYRRDLTPFQAEQLGAYIDQEGFEEDVVVRAIERAALAGGGMKLVLHILNDYAAAGAKTLEGAIAFDAEHEARRQRGDPRTTRQSRTFDILNQLEKEFEAYDTG